MSFWGTNLWFGGFTPEPRVLDADERTATGFPDGGPVGDSLLLEAGAIHKCDEHGWAKDRTDPHAREEALRIACQEPLAGLSSNEAVAVVREVLDSVGDTCPECE